MSKVALPMVGIFDTTLGRLVGISPEGATDVTTVATVETNLVTGRIGNLTAGGKVALSALKAGISFAGAQKWFGSQKDNLTVGVNGSPFGSTGGQLMLAEAPFVAVQLCVVNLAPNAVTGISSVVGVTETIDTTVAANLFKPVIGGVTYGNLAAAGSINGFRPVTWNGGAATVDLASGATVAQYALSDIIPLTSVPRADVVGALPAYISRTYHDGVNNGAHSFALSYAANRVPTPANRGRVLLNGWSGSNAVATLTTNVGLSTDMIMVFPIFHYATPALNVLAAGDSTYQNEGIVADHMTSWGWRGCADASSQNRPVNFLNFGCSGKASAEYWARAKEVINAGLVPDVLVIPPASVNDGWVIGNLERQFADAKARAYEIVRFVQSKGIRHLCFTPIMPYNSNTAAQDAYRVSWNIWLKSFAQAVGAGVLDFSAMGNGATPERWVPEYNYGADGIHPNELAIDTVMAPALTAYLNTI